MRARKYLWRGLVVYVKLVRGKWMVVVDGKCGEPSVVANAYVKAVATRELAQRMLDDWATRDGLEEWKR